MSKVSVGERFVTITQGSGRPVSAGILEKRTGHDGTVYSVLLDRVVHSPGWNYNECTWEAHGVFVTELVRKGYDPAKTKARSGEGQSLLAVLEDDELVDAVQAAVLEHAPDDWRGTLFKTRLVRAAVAAALDEDVDKLDAVMAVLLASA